MQVTLQHYRCTPGVLQRFQRWSLRDTAQRARGRLPRSRKCSFVAGTGHKVARQTSVFHTTHVNVQVLASFCIPYGTTSCRTACYSRLGYDRTTTLYYKHAVCYAPCKEGGSKKIKFCSGAAKNSRCGSQNLKQGISLGSPFHLVSLPSFISP